MLDITGVKVSVVQVGGLGVRRKPSGLSAAMVPGSALALSINFEYDEPQWLTEWGFAMKIVNASSQHVVLEDIDVKWIGIHRFRARIISQNTVISRGIDSVPDGEPAIDESQLLPSLVAPTSEVILVARMSMELGQLSWSGRFQGRFVEPDNGPAFVDSIKDVKIKIRTNLGRSAV